MSAERQVFKQMDLLIKHRIEQHQFYIKQAELLMLHAFKEFMDEHPEVEELHMSHDKHFEVMIGHQCFWYGDLPNIRVQLSKCLEALENKCMSMMDAFLVMSSGQPIVIDRTVKRIEGLGL